MKHRHNLLTLALISCCATAFAQEAATPAKIERVEVTGSLIKRVDKETPSVVQSISREDIRKSGYASIEEMLRTVSAVDSSSIGDGASSGFVSGLSTVSLRGFGSQGTLTLVNGRRLAPAAAVDVNFGRGNLVSVNTIPKGAVERIDILKDGASAMYGSDAMAGVVNYILRKDYVGGELGGSYTVNHDGVGGTKSANAAFGFGNLGTQRFNIYGGLEVSKRDRVMATELRNQGNQALADQVLNLDGSLSRFAPSSVASPYANYYRVPASLSGRTVIDGYSVANNSASGVNFLGSLAGCPDEMLVGKGLPQRLPGFLPAGTGTDYGTANMPKGMCRYDLDSATEIISKQDRIGGSLRGSFALSKDLTVYADVMLSKTTTESLSAPRALTTSLFTQSTAKNAVQWPKLDGSLQSFPALVLPVGHPDNPTNGLAKPEAVQLLYRFADIQRSDTTELQASRFTLGVEGTLGDWDIDSALLYSKQDMSRIRGNELRASLLSKAIADKTYRFGKPNDAAAIASVASDAVIDGKASIASVDLRASRLWFEMAGGKAGVALGAEFRRETLESAPNEAYQNGDFIGLVANGASGSRNSTALFGELSLPVLKDLEVQAALRAERYSDFGNANTGKLGFKWMAVPSVLLMRGTAATGFRAPSISQIGKSYASSFTSFSSYAVVDALRCDTSNPAKPVSKADPANNRDCNVLGFSSRTPNPGSLASTIAANPDLKPETSRSATLGLVFSPSKAVDLSLDAWYIERQNEIRSQRAVDIMEDANRNPTAPNASLVRDPNPQTWLPGVPNSGPILMAVRQYGNYNWTKTGGLDYDLTVRFPDTELGRFKLKVDGTYTRRYDYKILDSSDVVYAAGTTNSDMPKTKVKLTLNWEAADWDSFARISHSDGLKRSTTDTCLSSTSASNTLLRGNGYCYNTPQQSLDLGTTYRGFKNVTLSATVLNVMGTYGFSSGVPSVFNYYDQGATDQLGRRYTISANYSFD
ncbi:iron complex outermembrane receptor protein [Paucibacter oligotrophus]|uniref:Iron complex outermembrane receptor protein n=1 Tax=Roseateles oligotrophus TaxID=1769250 RepID=A0A840L8T3_9BURK|nr:TonB-dependent receptor [Roseateles oligotrophus]MBB4843155.1 iron complex outermembrane receptor protein [Roseateles oligotrophus]